jgi:hypothetical protein
MQGIEVALAKLTYTCYNSNNVNIVLITENLYEARSEASCSAALTLLHGFLRHSDMADST